LHPHPGSALGPGRAAVYRQPHGFDGSLHIASKLTSIGYSGIRVQVGLESNHPLETGKSSLILPQLNLSVALNTVSASICRVDF
jgi:hypothetical protein